MRVGSRSHFVAPKPASVPAPPPNPHPSHLVPRFREHTHTPLFESLSPPPPQGRTLVEHSGGPSPPPFPPLPIRATSCPFRPPAPWDYPIREWPGLAPCPLFAVSSDLPGYSVPDRTSPPPLWPPPFFPDSPPRPRPFSTVLVNPPPSGLFDDSPFPERNIRSPPCCHSAPDPGETSPFAHLSLLSRDERAILAPPPCAGH